MRDGTLESRLPRVLFAYRTTPHSTTRRTPAELLIGRLPRNRLDYLIPQLSSRVERKQAAQKIAHDKTACGRKFVVGDAVLVRNFPAGDSWIPSTIVDQVRPRSFFVHLKNGRRVKRHQDHIRARLLDTAAQASDNTESDDASGTDDSPSSNLPNCDSEPSTQPVNRRYPARDRRPPP